MDVVQFFKLALNKKKIISILLVFGLLVGILSYFIFDPIYETNVTFMVLESKILRKNLEGIKLDIDTYTSLINNVSVLRKVYDSLELNKKYDIPFDVFKEKFTVLSIENTSIIKTKIKFKDPDQCVKIADRLIEEVLQLNKNIILKEIESGYVYSEKQVEVAKQNLNSIKDQLNQFNTASDLKQMGLEIDILKNEITFHSLGNNINYPMIEAAATADRVSLVNLGLLSDRNNQSLLELNRDILNAENEIDNESADNIKMKYSKNLVKLKDLKNKKIKFIKELQKILDEKTLLYMKQLNDYNQLKAEYKTMDEGYAIVYKNFVEAKTEVMGKTKEMTVIDMPVKPDQQVFPRLILNSIAGIFLGMLIAAGYVIALNLAGQMQDD